LPRRHIASADFDYCAISQSSLEANSAFRNDASSSACYGDQNLLGANPMHTCAARGQASIGGIERCLVRVEVRSKRIQWGRTSNYQATQSAEALPIGHDEQNLMLAVFGCREATQSAETDRSYSLSPQPIFTLQ